MRAAGDFVYPVIHTACLKSSAEEVASVCTSSRTKKNKEEEEGRRGRGENWLLALFFLFLLLLLSLVLFCQSNLVFNPSSCDGAICFRNGSMDYVWGGRERKKTLAATDLLKRRKPCLQLSIYI